jgi:predicted O-methyltransferase YrrM
MNLVSYLWFLRRPTLYPEMFRRLSYSLTHPRLHRAQRELWKAQSAKWCAAGASPLESIARELEIDLPVKPIRDLHPQDWAFAAQAAEGSPVRMGGAAGAVELLYHACLRLRAEKVVETGVAYGWSSLAILLALERMGRGALVSIDMPYLLRENDPYVGIVVPSRLRSRWTLIRRPDRDALPKVIKNLGAIDLAHYDSDKSEPGRRFGCSSLWSALRPGGLLITDDIHDNLAFRDFCDQLGLKPWILPGRDGSYVGILKKPG